MFLHARSHTSLMMANSHWRLSMHHMRVLGNHAGEHEVCLALPSL